MIKIEKCPVCTAPLNFCFNTNVGDGFMGVATCRSCQSYIKSPFFDAQELAEIYRHYDIHERHYDPTEGELDNIRERLVRLEPFAPKGSKLLEIGCGRGYFLKEALIRGWQVRGVEFEGSAREHLLKEVEGCVGSELNLAGRVVDTVFLLLRIPS